MIKLIIILSLYQEPIVVTESNFPSWDECNSVKKMVDIGESSLAVCRKVGYYGKYYTSSGKVDEALTKILGETE